MDLFGNGKDLVADLVRLSRLFAKAGTPKIWQGELLVLAYLELQADKTTLPVDIKKALDLTSARVSAILNVLEKKGYVLRSMAVGDRRKIVVTITSAGAAYYERQLGQAVDSLRPIVARMGAADMDAFIGLLHKLTDILEEMERENILPRP